MSHQAQRHRLTKALCACACLMASSESPAQTLIKEGFESLSALMASGWTLRNASTPLGSTGVGLGDPRIFAAQAGTPGSYLSADHKNAASGGKIETWILSPAFSTEQGGTASFWLRGDVPAGHQDTGRAGVTEGGSSCEVCGLGDGFTDWYATGRWTQVVIDFAARGPGTQARFAIVYEGLESSANYIGIDSLQITSVPEPGSWLLVAGGLSVLAVRRRIATT